MDINYFADLFLHLDQHLADVINQYGVWTYAILFLIIFMETGVVITPFLPGDSLLFAAGALAATTEALNVYVLFIVLSTAAILGDSVNYAIGHYIGAAILGDSVNYAIGHYIGPRAFSGNIRFLKKDHLERTHQFYERYGGKTIVLARFIPIIRTFAPFVAGIGEMTYSHFIFYNVIGALLWCGLFVFGGYFFGNLPVVKENFGLVVIGIIVISVLPMVYEFIQNYRRKQELGQEQAPIES
jgi:membrane-associated protein